MHVCHSLMFRAQLLQMAIATALASAYMYSPLFYSCTCQAGSQSLMLHATQRKISQMVHGRKSNRIGCLVPT